MFYITFCCIIIGHKAFIIFKIIQYHNNIQITFAKFGEIITWLYDVNTDKYVNYRPYHIIKGLYMKNTVYNSTLFIHISPHNEIIWAFSESVTGSSISLPFTTTFPVFPLSIEKALNAFQVVILCTCEVPFINAILIVIWW